jgi:hypothetical protein
MRRSAKKTFPQILRHIGCVVLCLCMVPTQGVWAKKACALAVKKTGPQCPKKCPKKVNVCRTGCQLPVIHDQDEFAALRNQKETPALSGLLDSGSRMSLQGFPPSAALVVGSDNQNFTTGMFSGWRSGTDLFGIRNGTISSSAFSVAQMDPGMLGV